MPHIVNGFGTWRYGKKNLTTHVGLCPNCGKQANLTSYDTRLFVVAIMIPIVPLGARRIMEECSICKRHKVIKMGDWRRILEENAQAANAWRASPADAKLACEALGRVCAVRDLALYTTLGAEIETAFPRDAAILCTLADAADTFSRQDERRRLLERATEIDSQNPHVRESTAELFLDENRPDEAAPLLDRILAEDDPGGVNLLYHMAQVLQLQARHEEALVWFGHCERITPKIVEDPLFVKLRKASLKNHGRDRSVNPGKIAARARNSQQSMRSLRQALAVVTLIALVYLGSAFLKGHSRTVHLINGLAIPYTARIDGKAYGLAPGGRIEIKLAEGGHRVEMTAAKVAIAPPPTQIHFETPFLSRPLDKSTFVINPDRTALLALTPIVYCAEESNMKPPAPSRTFFSGDPSYVFDDIQCAFEIPPENISMGENEYFAVYNHLGCVTQENINANAIFEEISVNKQNPECFLTMAAWRFKYFPGDVETATIFDMAVEDPHKKVELLAPLLELKPVAFLAHHLYQMSMEKMGQDKTVAKYYAEKLAETPDDPAMLYLSGHRDPDRRAGLEKIRRAATGPNALPRAKLYLANTRLLNADFAGALEIVRSLPHDEHHAKEIDKLRIHAMLGAGDFEGAIEAMDSGAETMDLNLRMEGYCAAGRKDLARRSIDDSLEKIKQDYPEFDPEVDGVRLMTDYHIYAGEHNKATELAEKIGPSPYIFSLDALRGNMARAENLGNKYYSYCPYVWIFLYLAASQRGDAAMAARTLDKAIATLDEMGNSFQKMAAALRGDASVTPEIAMNLYFSSAKDKALYLTALGLRDPTRRRQYFSLARKLNFGRDLSHSLLVDIYGKESAE